MDELTYENEDGRTVYTAQYLKNKRTCCKSKCLHCPYGFTLESLGLEFSPITQESMESANAIISAQALDEAPSVASSLLASAYGKAKKTKLISSATMDKYFFVSLKGAVCGVVKKGILQVSEVFLKERFQNQGLDLHTINSFYESTL